MPLVSSFQDVQVHMDPPDATQPQAHIRVSYEGAEDHFDIESGDPRAGTLPHRPMRLVPAWIEIHRNELMANWELAIEGRPLRNIDPLR
jgi:Domain of unknown function (DUF4160)